MPRRIRTGPTILATSAVSSMAPPEVEIQPARHNALDKLRANPIGAGHMNPSATIEASPGGVREQSGQAGAVEDFAPRDHRVNARDVTDIDQRISLEQDEIGSFADGHGAE